MALMIPKFLKNSGFSAPRRYHETKIRNHARRRAAILVTTALVCTTPCDAWSEVRLVVLPLASADDAVLVPATLGVVVNENDPVSVSLGQYYASVRGVPLENIVELSLPRVNFVAMHRIKSELKRLNDQGRARRFHSYALAFDRPYRVDANQSLTAVFTQGVADIKWQGSCNLTSLNLDKGLPPGAKLASKPAMLLSGGGGLQRSKELVLRGKAADASDPKAEILFLKTQDRSRSAPREDAMDRASVGVANEISVNILTDDSMPFNRDIIGFQTGIANLSGIEQLRFVPGAYADILTSHGGALEDNRGQTTASDLIRAGATASYGTVREPCNFSGKFPDPERMLTNYLYGDSVIEAYWKSIDMVTEGLMVGDPLARPFPLLEAVLSDDTIELRVNRHTLPYIAKFHRKEMGLAQGKPNENTRHNVSIFSVETGQPRKLIDLQISDDAPLGSSVGTIRGLKGIDGVDLKEPILGFLVN